MGADLKMWGSQWLGMHFLVHLQSCSIASANVPKHNYNYVQYNFIQHFFQNINWVTLNKKN